MYLRQPSSPQGADPYSMLAGFPIGLFQTDATGLCLGINERACQMAGWVAQEIEGKDWLQLVHPDDQQRVAAEWQWVVQRDLLFESEFRCRHADGRVVWVLAQIVADREASGTILGYLGSLTDITRQKQVEDSLRRSQQQYQTLVQGIQGIVWEADGQTLRFSFVSQAAERLLGYPLDRWLMEPTFWKDHLHPEDYVRVIETCQQVTQPGQELTIEYRMVGVKGQVVWLRTLLTVVETDSGVKLRGFMVEINDLHREKPPELGLAKRCPPAPIPPLPKPDRMPTRATQGDPLAAPTTDPKTDPKTNPKTNPCISCALKFVEELAERQQAEMILRSLVEGTAAATGEHFFRSLTWHLAKALQVQYAFVAEFVEGQQDSAHLLAMWTGTDYSANFEYSLSGTPCEQVMKQGRVFVPDQVQVRFPQDPWLQQAGIESYLAIPLFSTTGVALGHLGVMHTQALQPSTAAESILRVFAARAGAELERKHTEEKLRSRAAHERQLYQQVRYLNEQLETQVQERTAQLQQALEIESALKRITDKVRDTLDETHILQTAVQELALTLKVEGCDAGIYSADLTISTIQFEYTAALSPALGLECVMADVPEPEIYHQLLQGQSCQFCLIGHTPFRASQTPMATLACPIVDSNHVLGDLWLFKPTQTAFNELEVRLVEQVANQCAIALRQARLYQAAQAQVEELARLNRLKDDFLSTISHELRTPMSSIKMATQMLEVTLHQTGLWDTQLNQIDQYFQILNEECRREINLINDLLDLSHLEAGIEPLTLSTLDLHTWIPYMAEPFEQRLLHQQQQLQIHIPADLPNLTTDFNWLARILTELLTNACKYTPVRETIAIAVSATPTTLHLAISNSGVAICCSEFDRIFEKFYRIPNHDPWKYGGTGLGLALVKKLVELLQGVIQVSSTANQTTFLVSLPLR